MITKNQKKLLIKTADILERLAEKCGGPGGKPGPCPLGKDKPSAATNPEKTLDELREEKKNLQQESTSLWKEMAKIPDKDSPKYQDSAIENSPPNEEAYGGLPRSFS